MEPRRVVITGMGAVTPVGNDVPTMWESLLAGKLGIGPLTRFDTTEYKASLAAEVKDFHPEDYFSRVELRQYDIYAQYAIAAASQAMEQSGIFGTLPEERLGVYFGTGIGGLNTLGNQMAVLDAKGPRRVSPYTIPMIMSNMAAGSIAIRFKAKGPCMSLATACATGSHALGEAYRAIRWGYADAMLAGGAESVIAPIAVAGFSACMALSTETDPARASLPFDRRRHGFVIGEGAGALVLEEYEHAVARGAVIYAELAGYGSTCDAHHITAPDPEAKGVARAISDALAEGGIDTDALYINAHGTGTVMNDSTETAAIKLALGEERAHKVLISSTKSMTGHMLGGTGAVEAIVAVLALRNQVVPPTVGLEEPDPACDLDYVPLVKREAPLEASCSVNLGFGGHNACVTFKPVKD